MGEAKRRKEWLESHPDAIYTPKGKREFESEDNGTQIVAPQHSVKPKDGKFTAILMKMLKDKRQSNMDVSNAPAANTEEGKKFRNSRRNKRRKMRLRENMRSKAIGKCLAHKPPTKNTCRRKRLALKHSGKNENNSM